MEKTKAAEIESQEPSLSALARAAGISPQTAFKRRERYPDADLEYILRPVAGPRNSGKASIAAAARENGLKPNTVQHRLRRGLTLTEALSPAV